MARQKQLQSLIIRLGLEYNHRIHEDDAFATVFVPIYAKKRASKLVTPPCLASLLNHSNSNVLLLS
jgi:hypothetical protein